MIVSDRKALLKAKENMLVGLDYFSSNLYCRQLTGRLEEAPRTIEGKVPIFEVK